MANPIPPEQQPLNQYRELQASSFFMWPALPLVDYGSGLVKLWMGVAALVALLTASTFSLPRDSMHWILVAAGLGNGSVLFVLLRLYLGWIHIHSRLIKANIVYEESGWYDGTVYVKTPEELTQHRLVAQYEVSPILQRLQRSLGVLGLLSLGEIVAGVLT